MVDGLFVGNILGPNAMASVNIASPFLQLIMGVSFIVSVGAQSYMGLNLGNKNIEKAQNVFKTSIIFILIMGISITLLGLIFNEQIAILLGANDVLLKDVSTYIKVIAIFTIPINLMLLFGFSNRIIEKPELYFRGMVLSLFTNIVLNYILTAKLNLDMVGTATATGCSYIAAFMVVVWPAINKNNVINIFVGKFDKTVILPVIYNGSSEGINSISTATCAYLFNMAFMKIAGEGGVAAFTSINYIAQFGILLMFGISDGICPIVSYNYGSKQYDRVDKILKLAFKICIIAGLIIFTTLFFFGEDLVKLFIQDNHDIIDLAAAGAKVYAFAFFMNGFNIVNSGYFTAIGNAKSSVIVAASRGLVFIIIGIVGLPMIFGNSGVWMSVPFAEVCTFFIGFYLMNKSNKYICVNA
jgi:putative MATE family efflux protein